MFIVFEGGEGCGKSTQAKRLYEYFLTQGKKVVLTREPGGTKNAEAIRELVVSSERAELPIMAELLLVLAARVDHWTNFIKPHLDNGDIVICDRFMLSTLAYQGYGRGLDIEWMKRIHHEILPDVKIDRTFVLLLPPEVALSRVKIPQKFEALGVDFHNRVYQGFKKMGAEWDSIEVEKNTEEMTAQEILKRLLSTL